MSINIFPFRFLSKMSIRTKLGLSAAITIGLALFLGLTVSLQYRNIARADRTERFTDKVIRDVSDLNSLSYAYLLLRDKRPRVQWQVKYKALGNLLSQQVVGDLEEEILLSRLRSNYSRLKQLFDVVSENIKLYPAGRENKSSLYDEINEGITAQLLARAEMMVNDASLLGGESKRHMDAIQRRSFSLVLASSLLLILSAALTYFLLAKSMGRSLRALGKGIERITGGDLLFRVDLGGHDELSRLAASFNDMTAKLETSYLNLEQEIGERKQAEKAVVELNQTLEQRIIERTAEVEAGKQRWATILTSIGDAVLAADLAGRITFLNPVAQALTGWQQEEALGQPVGSIFRVVNEKTLEPREDIVQRVLQEGSVVALANNTALISRAGQTIPIEDSAAPIKNQEGQVAGVVLVFHDVSEKRRVREALRESEQKYSIIFDQSPFAIALTKMPEITLVSVNPAFLDLFDYTREEVLGKNSVDLGISDPEAQAQVASELRERGLVRKFEAVRITKSGDRRILSLNLDWVTIGGEKYILTMIDDITKRRQAEEERQRLLTVIREERDRLSALINNIQDEVWFADTEKKLTLVNPAVFREFGSHDLQGDLVEHIAGRFQVLRSDGSLRPPDEAPPLRALLGETVKNQEEIVLTPAKGELRHRQVSAAPVRNTGGQIIGSVSVVRDITDLKQVEEALYQRTLELEHLNETLEERVRERTRELAELSAELVTAQEKERRRVSYDLHDNVWQILVAIRFDIERLFWGKFKKKEAVPEDKAKTVMADLLEAVGKIRSMQGDLWPYVLDDLGILATIDWYCREFEETHPALTIEKRVDLEENEIPNPAKIIVYRILQETLSNIGQHSRASHVMLDFKKTDKQLIFTVQDNGIGFDSEEIIAQRSPWGGLGLLNIKGRTELSGGTFMVESVLGKGTTVYASWPLTEA